MLNLFKAIPTLLLAVTVVVAQAPITITNPSASQWWVAQSQNVLAWDCKSNTRPQFTVLVSNLDKTKYPSPLAIIAQQNNGDCSKIITQDQASQPAGTGWQILFANPINNTDVWGTSDPFEIKPLGSLYPSQADASSSSAGAAASTSAGAAAPAKTGAAVGARNVGFGAVFVGVVAGVVGFAA